MSAMLAWGELNVAASSSIGHFTHEKSPIGAVAALATLAVIEEEAVLERANTLGAEFARQLRALKTRHPMIREVRACGMLFGIELCDDPKTGLPAADAAEAMLYACLRLGLSFKISSGTVLTLAPPLTIAAKELTRAADILDAAFLAVSGNAG